MNSALRATGTRAWSAHRRTTIRIEMRDRMWTLGLVTSEFNRYDVEPPGYRDRELTAVANVSAHVDAKWAALHSHRRQFGPHNLFRRLPEAEMWAMMSREYFTQARPAPPGNEQKLHCSFAGL